MKISDRTKLVKFIESKGLKAPTFSAKSSHSEKVTFEGDTGLIGIKDGFTFIHGPTFKSANGAEEQKAFDAFSRVMALISRPPVCLPRPFRPGVAQADSLASRTLPALAL